jgi:hypothetical protein
MHGSNLPVASADVLLFPAGGGDNSLFCARPGMRHFCSRVLTRCISEAEPSRSRLRFGLLSDSTARSIATTPLRIQEDSRGNCMNPAAAVDSNHFPKHERKRGVTPALTLRVGVRGSEHVPLNGSCSAAPNRTANDFPRLAAKPHRGVIVRWFGDDADDRKFWQTLLLRVLVHSHS